MVRRAGASLFAALLLSCAVLAQVVVEEVGAIQDAFAKAQADMQAYRFAQAVQGLDPVVRTLTEWEQGGRLQPSDEALLQRALELRGVADFNLGKLDAAREDFSHLVRLRPDYALTATGAAKILKAYEEVRSSLTGAVALTVEPPDAGVVVDGRALTGPVPPQIPLLKGLHVIRVARAGYDPVEMEVGVEVGVVKPLPVKLVPNARTIFFFVQPQGTELSVDGRRAGAAETRADARAEWAAFLVDGGFDPTAWWVIQAQNLPPGDHRVELACSCYGQKRFLLNVVLDKANNQPGLIKPIVLERRTLDLTVESRPSGAELTVDGKTLGTTPVELKGFCIGEHDFLVRKPEAGEYRAKLVLPDEAAYRLEADLRPTLLWAGLTRDSETTAAQARAAEQSLEAAVVRASTFNGVVAEEKNPLLPDTFFAPGVTPEQTASTVSALCSQYSTQGLLAGRVSKAGEKFRVTYRLLLPGAPGFEEAAADAADPAAAGETLRAVDAPLPLAPRDYAFLAVPGARGLLVVRAPGGEDGPRAGDYLVAVDGAGVPAPEDAARAFSGKEAVTLKFSRAGQDRTYLYGIRPVPPVVPYGGEGFGYRRLWLLSRQEVLSGGADARGLAGRMNAAFASLNLGNAAGALAALEGATGGFVGALRPASVAYARGVALLRLGRLEEARAALQQATADADAALDPGGEYPAAPLAKELLAQLPPPPPLPPKP